MKFHTLVVLLLAAKAATARYDPNAGDDWTTLKPDTENLPGSFTSLPYRFGIVVIPFEKDADGEFKLPATRTIQKSTTISYPTSHFTTYTTNRLTTVFTTAIVKAPKPTVTSDILEQINDGQVQKPDTSDYEKDDECDDQDDGYFYKRKNYYHNDDVDCDGEVEEEGDCDVEEEGEDGCEISEEEDCEVSEEDEGCDGGDGDQYYSSDDGSLPLIPAACTSTSALSIQLQDGILKDALNRIGSIVSSRQFQFDGPLPQFGSIYSAGWAITKEGHLSLGGNTKFYQCASGNFYNLYDSWIAEQCQPVLLDAVELIECNDEKEDDCSS